MTTFAALILPNLFLWGLFWIVLRSIWRHPGHRLIRGTIAVCAIVMSVPQVPIMVGNFWALSETEGRLESIEIDLPHWDVDAVVVLGGGMTENPMGGFLDASESIYFPSIPSLSRLRVGAQIAQHNDLPLLLTGGRTDGPDAPSEARVMADELNKHGDLSFALHLEEIAQNTAENAHYVAEQMAEQGWAKIILVTHASHGRRALATFTERGVKVVAVVSVSLPGESAGLFDFIPSSRGLFLWHGVGYELVGTIVYWLRGDLDLMSAVGFDRDAVVIRAQ